MGAGVLVPRLHTPLTFEKSSFSIHVHCIHFPNERESLHSRQLREYFCCTEVSGSCQALQQTHGSFLGLVCRSYSKRADILVADSSVGKIQISWEFAEQFLRQWAHPMAR